jgi:hypothetical protein
MSKKQNMMDLPAKLSITRKALAMLVSDTSIGFYLRRSKSELSN